ncbi:SGNH/GDSL hydrolase family protein [Stenotrophobium rhamnosiphilum]|uniref:SGNH/GDSL hydrolase family protein n=1 Tax=Stenotrophobium rhamnosiphilum TaxID=2029166 RepID=UPI00137531CD|nr:SGNH/GDSL hydrolase family protein [Stenotrophobium rhamnosiphilum]
MRIVAKLFGVLVLFVVLAGIGLAVHLYYAGRTHSENPQYVALGSSFAAGPGITERAPGSPITCGRSKDNYPHLLARKQQLSLVDVTCSGAITKYILEDGPMLQPAQINAVSEETELVTVTIGGNDVSYMGNLMALGCDASTGSVERFLGVCRVKSVEKVDKDFAALPSRLTKIANEVHARAPKARLIFVNYFTVLPESGTCKRLELSVEAADRMRMVAQRLASTIHDVALNNHAEVLDLSSLSASHNVCAKDPWLQGRHTGSFFIAPLHPNLEGMEATAEALNQLLDKPSAAQ